MHDGVSYEAKDVENEARDGRRTALALSRALVEKDRTPRASTTRDGFNVAEGGASRTDPSRVHVCTRRSDQACLDAVTSCSGANPTSGQLVLFAACCTPICPFLPKRLARRACGRGGEDGWGLRDASPRRPVQDNSCAVPRTVHRPVYRTSQGATAHHEYSHTTW